MGKVTFNKEYQEPQQSPEEFLAALQFKYMSMPFTNDTLPALQNDLKVYHHRYGKKLTYTFLNSTITISHSDEQ